VKHPDTLSVIYASYQTMRLCNEQETIVTSLSTKNSLRLKVAAMGFEPRTFQFTLD